MGLCPRGLYAPPRFLRRPCGMRGCGECFLEQASLFPTAAARKLPPKWVFSVVSVNSVISVVKVFSCMVAPFPYGYPAINFRASAVAWLASGAKPSAPISLAYFCVTGAPPIMTLTFWRSPASFKA